MKTIFDACTPRSDVLTGELRDDMFAAKLLDVMQGTADPIYQDPTRFFENTYPTVGLKTLASEVFGRLEQRSGAAAVVRLETQFGGGKTHNLIALYHLARASQLKTTVIDPDLMPKAAVPFIAGVVGSEMETSGLDHGDATTYTVWGEIAYQLGGKEGYARVAESDRAGGPAPGCQFIEQIVGDGQLLVMLDELARHLRSASARVVGNSTLAEQTVGFLMSLLEFASSRPRTAVVLTLADSKDAFAKETEAIQKELSEAKSVSARSERVLTPAGEDEIPAIVTHRLFAATDAKAAHEAEGEYLSYYRHIAGQDVDLPPRSQRAEFGQEIRLNYPFHPELLTTLNRKTSTIPNFQKTRGALRLLATAVRQLWSDKPINTYLIHPHHLDLSNADIANDLTSRLDRPVFKQIIEADIVSPLAGSAAHATDVDAEFVAAGKPPYGRRAATTIFLHSLAQGVRTGVDPADLSLAVLQPGDDPAHLQKALASLLDECWHLEYDGNDYRFKPEPALRKIVDDEVGVVGRVKAKEELDRRLKGIWKKGFLDPVYFPNEAGDVDDDANEPKVAVIHYDAAQAEAGSATPPELVAKIAERSGGQGGFRIYRNNVLFLVADKDQVERMVDLARRHLAIERIVGSPDRMTDFNDDQKKKLREMRDASDLEVRVVITRAYRFLYYPSQDAPADSANLQRETLPAQDQGDVKKDQNEVLLRVLGKDGVQKLLRQDDPPLPPAFIKAKAWTANRDSITTEDLRRTFAQRVGLKMLLDINQLKSAIKAGITSGAWVYFDAQEQAGYGRVSPAPLVQFGEDYELYTLEAAKTRGIKIKGEDTERQECPVCHQDPCVCGAEVGGGGGGGTTLEVPLPSGPLRAEGAPGQVFQALADQAHDKGVTVLQRLSISCDGMGKEGMDDVIAIGLAVPQFGKGDFRIDLSFTSEFPADGGGGSMQTTFRGPWDRYKRLKTVIDQFGKEASSVNVRMTVTGDFTAGLAVSEEQFATIGEVLTQLNLGKLTVSAEPKVEAPAK